MDYTTLKALNPSEFTEAAGGYRALSKSASASKDDIDNRVAASMRKALRGQAAEGAMGELKRLSDNFHYVQTECGLVSAALDGFAHDVGAAKRKLDVAVADAEAGRCTVNADGSVGYPSGGDKVDGKVPEGGTATGLTGTAAQGVGRQAASFALNPHYRVAQECADRIAEAVKEATESDERWAPKLKALKADDDLTVSDRDWVDAKSDTAGAAKAAEHYLDSIEHPPRDGNAEDNAQWWKGLGPEERSAYLALRPEIVGALDGVPSEVRDEANRAVFSETKAKYEMDLDSIPAEPANRHKTVYATGRPIQVDSDEWKAWNEKYGDRKSQLLSAVSGMRAIQSRFDRTGADGLPEAYLLGFDPVGKGDGKVILANGNPDTADHTAVYVPGTGTNLEGIEKDLTRGERLWSSSTALVPGQNVSTITWFDYDAPRSAYPGDKGDAIPEAMHDSYAEKAGPTLREFMDGNRVAHQAESAPATSGTRR
ncbi:alpha/beta hydrolase [Streptomyces sp. NPDC053720]|uniref:alpha/beta hydrolase n=1 Tax=Streptomyces sp. NPDC053720 TaxID=3154855 RepID=UPI00342365EA